VSKVSEKKMKMKSETIEDLIGEKNKNINYQKLYFFFNRKIKEIYKKEKATPLFDYADIRYTAMIDLIYAIMPSLKEEIAV